jgi:hypothetical protein
MPVTAMGSKWVDGYLKFFKKADGRVTGGFNSAGPTRAITRVDVDAQNATLPAATLAAGLLVHTSTTGGGTLTVDTATNLLAAFPEWQVGETMECHYLNDGNQTVTLTNATGVDRLSAQTIATLQGRRIVFLKISTSAFVVWAE